MDGKIEWKEWGEGRNAFYFIINSMEFSLFFEGEKRWEEDKLGE